MPPSTDKVGAGHVARRRRRRGSARRRRPPRACPARRAGTAFSSSSGEVGGHVGVDEARRDRVDGHAAARDLGGDGLGHADQAGLRRRVVGLPGVGARADDRGDVDHAAVAGADHRRAARAGSAGRRRRGSCRSRASQSSSWIWRASPSARTPALLTSASTGPSSSSARAEQRRRPRRVGDVAVQRRGAAAGRLDRLDDAPAPVRVGAVVDADGPAVGGQRAGDRGADAARGAGDEGAWPLGRLIARPPLEHAGAPGEAGAERRHAAPSWPGRRRPSSRSQRERERHRWPPRCCRCSAMQSTTRSVGQRRAARRPRSGCARWPGGRRTGRRRRAPGPARSHTRGCDSASRGDGVLEGRVAVHRGSARRRGRS